LLRYAVKKKIENTTQAVNTTPHIDQGKEATLVPSFVNPQKKKKVINGDQEGCRLDLNLSPDES
jgi:hypothetical protein